MRAIDFPHATVEISCLVCSRYGRYSKDRFCEIVGAETPLPSALRLIARTCPEDPPSLDNLWGRCRAIYPQLGALQAPRQG
jgi:hypothetical protein